MPQRLLELAHLRADRLQRHVKAVGGTGTAAFLGDDPESVQMAAVQRPAPGAQEPEITLDRGWFVQCPGMSTLPHWRAIHCHRRVPVVHAVSGFVALMLLALWSLAASALHAAAVWAVANAGALTGAASGIGDLRLADRLAPCIPPEVAQWSNALRAGLAPAVESLLQAASALAGGLTVVTWVVWGLGTSLLLALGASMQGLLAMWRRRRGSDGRRDVRVMPAA